MRVCIEGPKRLNNGGNRLAINWGKPEQLSPSVIMSTGGKYCRGWTMTTMTTTDVSSACDDGSSIGGAQPGEVYL